MDLYQNQAVADFYDLETADLKDDIPFFLRLAAQQRSPILELACGTGRILIPMAQAGLIVTGVDLSAPMLDYADAKVQKLPVSAQSNVSLVEADMRDFRFSTRFSMAFIAAHSFILLATAADQERMIRNVADHLAPGGLLVVDLFDPNPKIIDEPPGTQTVRWTREDAESQATTLRTDTVVESDRILQTRTIRTSYETRVPDAPSRSTEVTWTMRYTYPFELQHLVKSCGFKIEAVFGSYEFEPFETPFGKVIVVARKRG